MSVRPYATSSHTKYTLYHTLCTTPHHVMSRLLADKICRAAREIHQGVRKTIEGARDGAAAHSSGGEKPGLCGSQSTGTHQ